LELRQYPGNPLIPAPPEGLDLEGFRDHSVWREPDGNWSMVIGAGLRKKYGMVLRYTSPDLVQWSYAGELCAGPDLPATELYLGTMWECPGFVEVDGGHALMFSAWDPMRGYYSMMATGEYAEGRFLPRRLEKLDYGDLYFYAPQPFNDAQGRRLVMAWMQEGRSGEAQKAAGWSGVMSLPRQIHLDEQGRPLYDFIPELHSLRRAHTGLADTEVRGTQPLGLHGEALEIILELERGTAGSCGLLLRASPDGEESTRLVVDWANAELRVEREHASLDETNARTAHVAPLEDTQTCRLHIYLDHSALEVIANRRQAIATRIYPTRGDSLGTAVFTEEGSARITRLDAWKLSL
jgi:beta-fructofuranosidase